MKHYSQLTELQRYQIEALMKAQNKQKDIAAIIGVCSSTISCELKRNTGRRGYRSKQAQNKVLSRKHAAYKAIKMTIDVIRLIKTKIRLDWSPKQVSGWLNLGKTVRISHERIYSISGQINVKEERYTHTLGKATRNAKNNMGRRISAVKSGAGSVLMNALRSLNIKHESLIGKLIP